MAKRRVDLATIGSRYGLLVIWAAVAAGFSLFGPSTFATWSNFQTIFGTQSVILILGLGLCVALNAGETDLSITGVMSVSVVLAGQLNVVAGWPIAAVIVICLVTGALCGAVNSFFIVRIGIDPMVVTLGAGTLLSGISVAINQNTLFGVSPAFVNLARYQIANLPIPFWLGAALTILLWFALRYLKVGIQLRFVGSNRNASRLTGIRVNRLRTWSLITCSAFAALAGVVMVGTLGSSSPTVSAPYLLPAFAAAFLGSTTIQPGRFNPFGVFIAVFFLTTGITGIQLMSSAGWASDAFYGAAVVLAVAASTIVGKMRTTGRSRSPQDVALNAAPKSLEEVSTTEATGPLAAHDSENSPLPTLKGTE